MTRDRALFDMWPPFRDRLIEELDFYHAEAEKRLLSQFDNMSQEADKHADEAWEASGAYFDPDRHDPGDFAQAAYDSSINFYGLLDDMRKRTILSVISGLYFEFEKQLRSYISKEMMKSFRGATLDKKIWRHEIAKIYDFLEGCGWKVRLQPYFVDLEACRIIVNVHKHGKGSSLDELKEKYPEHLRPGFADYKFMSDHIDHTYMVVEREDIERFYKAIRQFWETMPLRIMMSEAVDVPEWVVNALQAPEKKAQS
jgi:hypothetical protein